MSFKYSDNPFHKKKEDTYKVYLNSITEIDDEKIEKYKRETIIRNFLYTDQSILEIIKSKDIFKIEYFDSPILSKTFAGSNITVLIDKSKEKRGESVFHIPINHDNIIVHNHIYSISPKSNLKFNILKIKDDIVDFYFTTNEDLEHAYIKEDLFTFVSLLN